MNNEELFLNFANLKEIKLPKKNEISYRDIDQGSLSLLIEDSHFKLSNALIPPKGGYHINCNIFTRFDKSEDFYFNFEEIMNFRFTRIESNTKIRAFLKNLSLNIDVLKNTLDINSSAAIAKLNFTVNEHNEISRKELNIELFINSKYKINISFIEAIGYEEKVTFYTESCNNNKNMVEKFFNSNFDKEVLTKMVGYQAMLESGIELQDINIESVKGYLDLAEIVDF